MTRPRQATRRAGPPAKTGLPGRPGPTERPDRGSTAVELVLITPLLMLLLFLAVAAGRGWSARMTVESAARQAARAATTTRSPAAAVAAATATAQTTLAPSAACRTHQIHVDTSRFVPGGTVAVTVSCQVDLTGLAGLDLPTTKTISARFVSPIDTFISVSGSAGQL